MSELAGSRTRFEMGPMKITIKNLRAQLEREEPDYAAAARLGPAALPVLEQLIQGEDTLLAAKAAYLASLISSPEQEPSTTTASSDEVRAQLEREEPDYDAAARLGPAALPVLEQLIQGEDTLLAAKAAYLASLIPGPERRAVLQTAANSAEPTVRVAAAAGLRNLSESEAAVVADGLMGDDDVGVRRQVLRSVAGSSSARIADRVRQIAERDPDDGLRRMATELNQP